MLWSASLPQKEPIRPGYYIYSLYLTSPPQFYSTQLYSTLNSFFPSFNPLPLLFFPPFSTFTIPPIFLTSNLLNFHKRLHASVQFHIFSCYIYLSFCAPGTISSSVTTFPGLGQPHRTAPCETKAVLVESVTISLVNIPLAIAPVISSVFTIASVEGVRFSHGSLFPHIPGSGRRERNNIAHPDSTRAQALLRNLYCDNWMVTSSI